MNLDMDALLDAWNEAREARIRYAELDDDIYDADEGNRLGYKYGEIWRLFERIGIPCDKEAS
jgi:hypothetical protein